jgi:hypothetical protein
VTRVVRNVVVIAALAALAAPAAFAGERMWIGFHDDPSYRWVANRNARIERAAHDSATITRLLVQWNVVAPNRPSRPASPFDPAYRFDDLDEALRAAQLQDQEAMLTISGTPRWAGGGAPNRMPHRIQDFRLFSQAIAARYSGRFAGYPFVRFWSVWNEPNLTLFLTPQFDRQGRSVAPANYAKLYAAGYAGIKAGNPLAKVAIGETSSHGRDHHRPGLSDTHSPGRFAELVAEANPRLRFDAWAHHPYPVHPKSTPAQVVQWPNVSLASLPRFAASLRTWFRRPSIEIWVTEYGHQTRPQDPFGVTYAQQAQYVRQSIEMVRKLPFVGMFVWFIYQDNPGQPWESGIYTRAGASKGRAAPTFRRTATPLDARYGVYSFRRGTSALPVRLYVRRYCATDHAGTPIGMTWRVYRAARLVAVGQQSSGLLRDCTVTARLRLRQPIAKGQTYTAVFDLNDRNGTLLTRSLTIHGT